eukprot:5278342-Pyramimonas_sp.AAC.1
MFHAPHNAAARARDALIAPGVGTHAPGEQAFARPWALGRQVVKSPLTKLGRGEGGRGGEEELREGRGGGAGQGGGGGRGRRRRGGKRRRKRRRRLR